MEEELVDLFSSKRDYRIFISHLWDITTDIIGNTGAYVTREGLHSYINREDDYNEYAEGVRMYGRDSALSRKARDNTNFVEVDEIDKDALVIILIGRRLHNADYHGKDKCSSVMGDASHYLTGLFAENSMKDLKNETIKRIKENSILIDGSNGNTYEMILKEVNMRIDEDIIREGLIGFSLRFILTFQLINVSSIEPGGEEYERKRIHFQSLQ